METLFPNESGEKPEVEDVVVVSFLTTRRHPLYMRASMRKVAQDLLVTQKAIPTRDRSDYSGPSQSAPSPSQS